MNISVRVKEGPEDCEASRWSSPAKREETMAARWGTSGTMKARYLEGGTGHEGRGAGKGRIPDTYLRGSTGGWRWVVVRGEAGYLGGWGWG